MFTRTRRLFHNKIQLKIALSIFVVSIIPLIACLCLNSFILSQHFERMEYQIMNMRIKQAQALFTQHMANLHSLTQDYSHWDEALERISSGDKEWFKQNFSNWLSRSYQTDMVLVLDKHNNIIDSFGITNQAIANLLEDPDLEPIINGGYASRNRFQTRIKQLNGDLFMIAVSPIHQRDCLETSRSDYRQSQGTVVFGRKINPLMLQQVEHLLGCQVGVTVGDKVVTSYRPEIDVTQYHNLLADINEKEVIKLDDKAIIEFASLSSLSDNNIGLFVVQTREQQLSSLRIARHNGYVLVIVCFVVMVILSTQIVRKLTIPIKRLETQISTMNKTHNLSHVEVTGNDEIARLASTVNALMDTIHEHRTENAQLRTLTNLDELTSVYNYRYFHKYINEKTASKCEFHVLFCDIDHQGMTNNINSYSVGDAIIKDIAEILREIVQDAGTICRFKGEKFIVLLEQCTEAEAFNVAEGIRFQIENDVLLQQKSAYFPITMSIGIAGFPLHAENSRELIRKAAEASHYAQLRGGNLCQMCMPRGTQSLDEQALSIRYEMLMNSAKALAAAIDTKDSYTGRHSESVVKYAMMLAQEISLSPDESQALRVGALLHDCGKIGVPDSVIHKNGRLTNDEFEVVKKHPAYGYNIVKYMIDNPHIASCVLFHHERWDGKGYPQGLSRTSIPLFARIVCVADSYHAMVSDRPYRAALSTETALNELRKNAGTQFDPKLVSAFIEVMQREAEVDAFYELVASCED